MYHLFQSGFAPMPAVNTHADLHCELAKFTRRLEFDTYSAVAVVDQPAGEPQFFQAHNTPEGYRDGYHDLEGGKRDPVAQHCKHHGTPIVWDQSTYRSARCMEMWETQAQFGYKFGISLALHLPKGRHLMVGVDRDQPLPRDPAQLMSMTAALALFSMQVEDAAMRVLVPESSTTDVPSLTPRELETLRWTMEGKTAWEIGRILSIAENTVIRHAHSAARKLGCTSKHHAVVKALRLGLID